MNLNKCKLQEMCQSRGWALPQYSGTRQGPPHMPRFSASVLVHGFSFTIHKPLTSKKEAECFAASLALDHFNNNSNNFNINPTATPKHPGLLYLKNKEENDATHTRNETASSSEGKMDACEMERRLAEERQAWQREKHQLELRNIELENQIDVKQNELEHCRMKLQYMDEKAETLILLAENRKEENKKLHSEILELKDRLQAKQAVNVDFEAQKKIETLELLLKEKNQELTEMPEFYSALTFKERIHNKELLEARTELIGGLKENSKIYIGVKTIGDLDLEAFQVAAKRRYASEQEADERAVALCSEWEGYLGDSRWHPIKVITDDKGIIKEVIDEDDLKLKNLKRELGVEVYNAVKTALLELHEHNSSGRYKVQELWNFKAGRKATVAEGVAYILKQWNATKKRRRN